MKLERVRSAEAVGHILCHNIVNEDGRKALRKGQTVAAEDVATLRRLGHDEVHVAVLEAGDVHEDEVADRVGQAALGLGLEATPAAAGRVNYLADRDGLLQVNAEAMKAVNALQGITVATVKQHSLVSEKDRVGTVKIIPYAVPKKMVEQAEQIARKAGGLVAVALLSEKSVGVILTGTPEARESVFAGLEKPICSRVEELGSEIMDVRFALREEKKVAQAIRGFLDEGAELIFIAGDTSIMDAEDITPQGVRLAGGQVEQYGVPVEPGNQMMMAYVEDVPVIGAPGCVRSRKKNIVDLILPRVLAGEHISRDDILEMGVGGLM